MVLMIVEYFNEFELLWRYINLDGFHLFRYSLVFVNDYICLWLLLSVCTDLMHYNDYVRSFVHERFLVIFNIQDQWQLWSLGSSSFYSGCGMLSKIIPNMIPAWSKNDQEIIPKWSRSHPKIIPNSSRHDPKVIPKWFQSHLPKLSKSNLKIVSKSTKSDAKHTSSHWFL